MRKPTPSFVWPAALLSLALLSGGCRERPYDAPGLLQVWGSTGMGPGEFSYPRGIVRHTGGDLFIVDKAARIQRFKPDGVFVCDWRMPEWSAGKPTGLGVGPDGLLYVADTHYARVMIFDPNGAHVGAFGAYGHDAGEFVLPTDVAVTPGGTLYVSEYGDNDRISFFTAERTYVRSFGGPNGGPATLARPQSLLLDADGTLWVTDACNHRVCHFSAAGELLDAFGQSGSAPGELRFPYGIDMLSDGTLVVCEYGNNRVQRFDRDGTSRGTWGRAGREPGELAYPWAVAVGPDDRIYVLDSGNNRVQVIAGGAAETWQRP